MCFKIIIVEPTYGKYHLTVQTRLTPGLQNMQMSSRLWGPLSIVKTSIISLIKNTINNVDSYVIRKSSAILSVVGVERPDWVVEYFE
jgi:hypothetical protein